MRPAPVRDAILALMVGGQEMRTGEIAVKMQKHPAQISDALNALRLHGHVARIRRGVWKLAEQEDSEAPPSQVPGPSLKEALAAIERGLAAAGAKNIINPYATSLHLASLHLRRAIELREAS